MNHTPEAVAGALDWYRSKFDARKRYEGQPLIHDEVLVAEIDRLTALLQPTGDDEGRALALAPCDCTPTGGITEPVEHTDECLSWLQQRIAEALAAVRAGERAGYGALVTALETINSLAPAIGVPTTERTLEMVLIARTVLAAIQEPGNG